MGLTKRKFPKFDPREALKLPIDEVYANAWNPNVLPKDKYEKLKNWITECRAKLGKVPAPIVVRPRKGKKGGYEIIDGEHRWRATAEVGFKDVDAYIYDCDDTQAKLLTNSLNYLKGEPDPDKESVYIQDLISNGLDLDVIADHTHYTRESLDDIVLSSGIEIEEVGAETEKIEEDDIKKIESWTDIKFTVPVDVAEIVEAEIARIGATLTGKGIRGRALEFMAINSANTPLPEELEKKKVLIFRKALRKKK